MILSEKERTTIEDLQTQEKSCIEKYGMYAGQAKDPELKKLFQTLQSKEREHYDSLGRVLKGTVPSCDIYSHEFTGRKNKGCISCNGLYWNGKTGVRRI